MPGQRPSRSRKLALARPALHIQGDDRQAEGIQEPRTNKDLVESLHLLSHYVTCLVRFGSIFCGLGLTVLAVGLLRGNVLPWWFGGGAAGLGVAAMALTMLWPDNWALYTPVFHLQALWLAATGAYLLLYGIGQGS
jgi:hypothetical protein